ncbi:uncharacterized protein PFL1_02446 [Pseudozyma flocculosa PF-1]|nr:uncharacterized protein PFL1_02446 [Pseudozyma flocculosa PF-1]EPQ29773.1 hypothetical protein PFL1_02446 [Pseudozyma flocculosa PF-1]
MSSSPPSSSSSRPPSATDNHNNPFFRHGGGPTLDGVANLIKHPATRKVMVLAGAGISTSATPPIPDFRTPATGLYDNLAKYSLPYPEAIFDIEYFQQKPQPFFTLAKELYPGNFKPSLTHYFFSLLHTHGKLGTVFTQNVDTLERIAGLPADRIVEAHGSFASAACIKCRTQVEPDWMRAKVMAGQIARCEAKACRKRGSPGLVKPDIVFFGEGLPDRFFKRIRDLRSADLLIVVGTSLQVQPFASLIDAVPSHCPRVLINLERVGELAGYDTHGGGMGGRMNESGFDFDGLTVGGRHRTRDVFWGGKADEGVLLLARALGWEDELLKLKKTSFAKLDEESGVTSIADTRQPPGDKAEEVSSKVASCATDGAEAEAATPAMPRPNEDEATRVDDEVKPDETDQLSSALSKTTLGDGGSTASEDKDRAGAGGGGGEGVGTSTSETGEDASSTGTCKPSSSLL